MTLSDRVYLYNRWFDRLPEHTQFLAAFWTALGITGVLLTIYFFLGWPFDFMAGLVTLVIMGPRVAFKFGLIDHAPNLPPPEPGEARIAVKVPDWVFELNHRWDALPEMYRGAAVMAGIIGGLAVNLLLNWIIGLPVGLLLMLALLVLGWARVVYVYGWAVPAVEGGTPVAAALEAPSPVLAPNLAEPAPVQTKG
jgi:hypothetical protein